MVELKKQLTGFMETVRETEKILRNGWLMASIAFFTTLAYSLLLLANFLSFRSLVTDLIVKWTPLLVISPSSAEFANLLVGMQNDFRLFVGAGWVFVLAYFLASVLFSTATVIASAIIHTGQSDLSRPRDVALAAARCLKRPLITSFYVSIFGLGYMFLLLAILLPIMLSRAISFITVATCVCAMLFYAYLSVVWTMGMVVSVLEEKSGMEAFGKAWQLVKGGLDLKGFGISLLVTILSYGVGQIWKVAIGSRSSYVLLLVGLVAVNGLWLVRMYGLTGFTVLYYEGKRNHGEETETVLGMDYTKIPSLPLIAGNLP
ncbi:uncharacterized protein LOC116193638 [Punica granatum]|uniref:Uncharacterized protein n=2 Tax=Punica granatum TaxID=22663 RepID=A0A218XY79_PUNGR|nr:uncharacterized protein LOC116189831 [Punica granatum]XP_031378240.1 uncharacterized protein LOC116193638 [Punica granatum]OWM89934.1 hypothetical protein CDL15_Pgr012571 [Punica granatum]PKI50815.1 hypothetical protein CRG98_028810 [Punica granatum]